MRVAKFISVGILMLACAVLYGFCHRSYKSTCPDELHMFADKGYVVNLCAIKYNLLVSATMRLQVYSNEMELLADRIYESDVNQPAVFYKQNRIEYLDGGEGVGVIEIPPTRLDWIRARIL